jgi:chaperone modulatory protein CbpM
MTQAQVEFGCIEGRDSVTLAELSRCCKLSESELGELVDYCALEPLSASPERVFSTDWVAPLQAAGKLRLDFDLDLFTVAILLGNLSRIEVLERKVQHLQALLPWHLQPRMRP